MDGFELTCGEAAIEVPHSAARLIAFVAFAERPLLRSYVSETLWPDSDLDHASASLRSALWRSPSPGGGSLLVATATHVSLDCAVEVDVRRTVSWARAMLARPRGEAHWTFAEIARLDGDLLPDWYDDWIHLERERYRQLRLHALESLSDQLRTSGRYGEAMHAGLAALAIEPLRESAHRRVIAVHLDEGNVAEAIRQYRTYQRLLDEELSLQPTSALRSLMGPLLRPTSG